MTGLTGLPTPTGTVTFSWFTNGTCTAPAAATSSPFTLNASGVADGTTFPQTPGVPGSFAFRATYSGDGTYDASTGPCELLTVNKAASSTVTVIHDAAHQVVTSVPAGTTVHDQATVTGASGDADGDGDVLVVHQRHLHRTRGGHVERRSPRRIRDRGRHRVPADAERVGELRVPGHLLG